MSGAAAGLLAGLARGMAARQAQERQSPRGGILERLGMNDASAREMAPRMGGEAAGRSILLNQAPSHGQVGHGARTPLPETAPVPQAAPPATPGLRKASIGYSPEIDAIISGAAERYGENADYFRRLGEIESGGDATRKNPRSSAGGLWQFVDATAKTYGLNDRYDPAESTDAVMRLTRDNRAALKKALGREPTFGELYLAHQQGSGGASALLRDPSLAAIDALTPIYKGDRRRARAAIRLNGGTDAMTAGEFASRWSSKFDVADTGHAAIRRALKGA